MSSQKEAINTRISVERLDNCMSFVGIDTSIQPHVGDRGHSLFEEVVLDDVEHELHLTEDEASVLWRCSTGHPIYVCFLLYIYADSTVVEQLPRRKSECDHNKRER